MMSLRIRAATHYCARGKAIPRYCGTMFVNWEDLPPALKRRCSDGYFVREIDRRGGKAWSCQQNVDLYLEVLRQPLQVCLSVDLVLYSHCRQCSGHILLCQHRLLKDCGGFLHRRFNYQFHRVHHSSARKRIQSSRIELKESEYRDSLLQDHSVYIDSPGISTPESVRVFAQNLPQRKRDSSDLDDGDISAIREHLSSARQRRRNKYMRKGWRRRGETGLTGAKNCHHDY